MYKFGDCLQFLASGRGRTARQGAQIKTFKNKK